MATDAQADQAYSIITITGDCPDTDARDAFFDELIHKTGGAIRYITTFPAEKIPGTDTYMLMFAVEFVLRKKA